ncbi:hypothetical protein MTO96_029553 [Rhipicephalus appendiculatus]
MRSASPSQHPSREVRPPPTYVNVERIPGPRNKLGWRLDPSLLEDETCVERIRDRLRESLRNAFPMTPQVWDDLKTAWRTILQEHGRARKRRLTAQMNELLRRMRISRGADSLTACTRGYLDSLKASYTRLLKLSTRRPVRAHGQSANPASLDLNEVRSYVAAARGYPPSNANPSNKNQSGDSATTSARESTSGLQVLKPKFPPPTSKKAPNYWENKGVEESDDTRAALTPPTPAAVALDSADDSGSAGRDGDLTAGSGPEPSSAVSSRDSRPASQTESEEQQVPKTEGRPDSDAHALPRVDDESFAPFPPAISRAAKPDDTPIFRRTFSAYAEVSGAEINEGKSKALLFGHFPTDAIGGIEVVATVKVLGISSRIDRAYVPDFLLPSVVSCEVLALPDSLARKTHHAPLVTTVRGTPGPRCGDASWRLDPALLKDDTNIPKIKDLLEDTIRATPRVTPEAWDNLKATWKALLQKEGRERKRRITEKDERTLEQDENHPKRRRTHHLHTRLSRLEASAIRQAAPREDAEARKITEAKRPDVTPTADPTEITAIFRDYFRSAFQETEPSEAGPAPGQMKDLCKSLRHLDEDEYATLCGEASMEEFRCAIGSMPPNSAPGTDGLHGWVLCYLHRYLGRPASGTGEPCTRATREARLFRRGADRPHP